MKKRNPEKPVNEGRESEKGRSKSKGWICPNPDCRQTKAIRHRGKRKCIKCGASNSTRKQPARK